MNDDEYMKLVAETLQPADHAPFWGHEILYFMVGLAGEAGEVANMAQKVMRGDFHENDLKDPREKQNAKIIDEIGGVFWFLYGLCDRLGVSPAEVRRRNAATLLGRKDRGTLQGDGDGR